MLNHFQYECHVLCGVCIFECLQHAVAFTLIFLSCYLSFFLILNLFLSPYKLHQDRDLSHSKSLFLYGRTHMYRMMMMMMLIMVLAVVVSSTDSYATGYTCNGYMICLWDSMLVTLCLSRQRNTDRLKRNFGKLSTKNIPE